MSLGALDLISTLERCIHAPHELRNAVRRVERLVRVGRASEVRIRRHLPAAHVDCLESGTDLLHRLVPGDRAERSHIRFLAEQPPQPCGAVLRQRVFDAHRAAQPENILRRVGPHHALPTPRRSVNKGIAIDSRIRGVRHDLSLSEVKWFSIVSLQRALQNGKSVLRQRKYAEIVRYSSSPRLTSV